MAPNTGRPHRGGRDVIARCSVPLERDSCSGVKYRRSEGSTPMPWIIALLAVIVIAVVVWVWWFWGFGSGSGGGRDHHK
jgi:hypothetical protein